MNKNILDQIPKDELIRYLLESQKQDEETIGIIELADEYLINLENIGRTKGTITTYTLKIF